MTPAYIPRDLYRDNRSFQTPVSNFAGKKCSPLEDLYQVAGFTSFIVAVFHRQLVGHLIWISGVSRDLSGM